MEPNNIFNDIKPLTKYTTSESNSPSVQSEKDSQVFPTYELRMKDPLLDLSRTKNSYKGVWFFAVLAILILVAVLSFMWAQATVVITAKEMSLPIDATLVLSKDSNELAFETVQLEKEIPINLGATEKVDIKEKSKGEITIYNSFSSSPQKLVKNTRFENSEGLLFRIEKDISVPGYKTIDSKVVSGEITVSVNSDQTGERYNIKKDSTLTIPGFKSSAQYDKIFAKNKNDFTGGGEGTYYKSLLPKDDIEKNLLLGIKSITENQVAQKIPADYISFSNLYSSSFDSNQNLLFKNDIKNIQVPVSLEYVIFKKADLEAFIRKNQNIPENEKLTIDSKNLNASLISATTNEDGLKQYSVAFSGFVKKHIEIPESEILNKIAGKSKTEFLSTIESFNTSIDKAELSIKPFWIFKIPKDTNKIKIIKK